MNPRLSLHLGCAVVESEHPLLKPWPKVEDAPREAEAGGFVARQHGFTPLVLTAPSDVTAKRVVKELRQMSEGRRPVDLFISFAGHGFQRASARGGEPRGPCPDDLAADEFWVLNKSVLCDNTLAQLWVSLPAGSRVLVVADCCHSGGSFFEPFEAIAPRLVERFRLWQHTSRNDAADATTPCPEQPNLAQVEAGIIGFASTAANDITKPGLMSALRDGLALNPPDYPAWIRVTNEILESRPDGPKKVVTCKFGQGAPKLWNGPPLA